MMCLLCAMAASAGENASSGVRWNRNSITIFQPKNGGAWYPRLLRLKNGDILCAYDTNENHASPIVQISRSKDKGKTWQVLSQASFGEGSAANGQLLQLPDGTLLCAYRLVKEPTKTLKVSHSTDNGATWTPLSEITANTEGVWEPHLLQQPDGEILVFYASEGVRPQIIALKRSRDGGKTWGKEETVASHPKSRDGMPVVERLPSGALIVVFEAQDTGHPFLIRSMVSDDGGKSWHSRGIVYAPENRTKRAGAPYIVLLPNGNLMASFQTDENRSGNGEAFCDMKTVLSSDGGKTWDHVSVPFGNKRGAANWNTLFVMDDKTIAAVTSTNADGKFAIKMRLGRIAR